MMSESLFEKKVANAVSGRPLTVKARYLIRPPFTVARAEDFLTRAGQRRDARATSEIDPAPQTPETKSWTLCGSNSLQMCSFSDIINRSSTAFEIIRHIRENSDDCAILAQALA